MCRSLSEPADPRAFAAELLRKALPTTEGDATFDDAARAFLDLVCGAMNWCVGRVWRPDPAQPGLRLATAWAASGECGSATHPATADVDSTIPFSARTVVGDAVEQSAPVWREIVDDSRFVSLPADDPLRSRRLFAFPVIADERVVAVLEFVADEPHDAILLSSVLDLAVSRLSAIAEMEQCEAERERLSAVVEHSVQPVF
ncbi:MAG TPA: GAF domain-containing protein, partial [Pirellulales bacterium]